MDTGLSLSLALSGDVISSSITVVSLVQEAEWVWLGSRSFRYAVFGYANGLSSSDWLINLRWKRPVTGGAVRSEGCVHTRMQTQEPV